MAGSGRKTIEMALLLSFALSGAASLIAQTIWQRELLRLVGATTPATAIVYAGVMAGLGAGALLGNAILTRGGGLFTPINPLRFFALLEAISGAFALVYAYLFGADTFSQFPALADETIRLALAFILVAFPSLVMGATWPAAVASGETVAIDAERSTMFLYSVNLLGAMFGAAYGAFYLIPTFGLSISLAIAGGFNVLSGACALLLSLAAVKLICPRNPIETAASSAADAVMPQFDYLLVALSAAATLALEVTYTRLFTLLLGSSTYSVAVVLTGVLFGMYISAQMGNVSASIEKKGLEPKAFASEAASIAALIIFCEACLFNKLPEFVLYLSQLASSFNFQDLPTYRTFLVPRAFLCQWLVILPVAFISAVFPIILSGSLKEVNSKTARAGWLYSASTFGAVIGSLAAGLFFIPVLSEKFESGLLASLIVISGICLLIAALAAARQITIANVIERRSGVIFLGAASTIGLLATLFLPRADTLLLSQGLGLFRVADAKAADAVRASIEEERKNSSVIFYREGLNTTVSVQDMPKKNVIVLKNDGKVEAAIPRELALSAPTSDYPTQVLLSCLPYVLSSKRNTNSLVIGCGSGVTYGALAEQEQVSRLTVAEIEKSVFEASQFFLPEQKKEERADIRKLICDARNHLAFAPETYDLIVSQPAEPWVNGAGDLYTKEFFQLASSRLNEGGVFCQWLQLYSIDEKMLLILLNTIHSAFPSTYVFHPHGSGEILIVSFKSQLAEIKQPNQPVKEIPADSKLDVTRINSVMAEKGLSEKLAYCNIVSLPDLLSMLVLTPQSLDELLWKKLGADRILFNTDDNLRSEYSLPHQLLDKDDRIEKNLAVLYSIRSSLTSCLVFPPGNSAEQRAAFFDAVALSMAGFSQKHPGESIDDAALAAAYEAWTLSESTSTAAACDVIAYMTGRFSTAQGQTPSPREITSLTPYECFWVAQAEALKGNKERALAVVRQGLSRRSAEFDVLTELLHRLNSSNVLKDLAKTAADRKTSQDVK